MRGHAFWICGLALVVLLGKSSSVLHADKDIRVGYCLGTALDLKAFLAAAKEQRGCGVPAGLTVPSRVQEFFHQETTAIGKQMWAENAAYKAENSGQNAPEFLKSVILKHAVAPIGEQSFGTSKTLFIELHYGYRGWRPTLLFALTDDKTGELLGPTIKSVSPAGRLWLKDIKYSKKGGGPQVSVVRAYSNGTTHLELKEKLSLGRTGQLVLEKIGDEWNEFQ